MSTPMIAITTSNSTRVNARTERRGRTVSVVATGTNLRHIDAQCSTVFSLVVAFAFFIGLAAMGHDQVARAEGGREAGLALGTGRALVLFVDAFGQVFAAWNERH